MVTQAGDVAAGPVSAAGSLVDAVRRRWSGAWTVDPWGLDLEAHALAAGAASLRWSVSIGAIERLPVDGPVLLVANQRLVSLSPVACLLVLGRETGRVVRFAVSLDVEPLGTFLRRLGAVVGQPAEIASVLRAGEVGLVWCRALARGGARVGPVPPKLIVPAIELGVPVLPVAFHGNRLGRLLRVELGPPLPRRRGGGPLTVVELADAARTGVQDLLDEATPPRWPFS